MGMKSDLEKLLSRGHQFEGEFVRDLTDEERNNPGSFETWSPRDVLVHSIFWKNHTAHNLEKIRSGAAPEWIREYHEQNAAIYKEHASDSWEMVLDFSEAAQEYLLNEVALLSEEVMPDTEYMQQEQKQPAWQHILGAGYTHVLMHLADYWIKHNQEGRARRAYAEMSRELIKLDDSPVWQGTILYNQACIEALAGSTGKALELLEQALPLHPGLRDWSQQDTDLVSLHELPEFRELVRDQD